LSTTKSIIYAYSAKICFTIKDRKEKFTFKKRTLKAHVHPQASYIYEDPTTATRKKNINNRRRKSKAQQPRDDSVWMVNTIDSGYD
jgi:hypothetical protein